jgi:hypothetical protein
MSNCNSALAEKVGWPEDVSEAVWCRREERALKAELGLGRETQRE